MTVLSRHALLRAALIGFGLGAAWGVAARAWMRLVSTAPAPEFSWAGTLFIVSLAALFGLCVGVAVEARRQRRSRWWSLAAIPGALLFAGQGMLFLPGSLAASLLMRYRSTAARVAEAAALFAVPVLTWWSMRLDEDTMLSAPLSAQVSMLIGMPALGWWLAWYARDLWSVKPVAAQSDSPDRALSSRRSDSSLEVPAGPA